MMDIFTFFLSLFTLNRAFCAKRSFLRNGSLSVVASFGIDADHFAEIMSRWNGRDCGVGGVTMQ